MCQEIWIDGKEVLREDDTCWCPLSGSYGAEKEPAAIAADKHEQQKAYAELGKLVWQALCRDRHPGAPEWISEIALKRY